MKRWSMRACWRWLATVAVRVGELAAEANSSCIALAPPVEGRPRLGTDPQTRR